MLRRLSDADDFLGSKVNISDHENIYEIHTTNHVDHSYSYSSPTENPDVKEPEKIQSTPYFRTDFGARIATDL
jgi:hypothetical protein